MMKYYSLKTFDNLQCERAILSDFSNNIYLFRKYKHLNYHRAPYTENHNIKSYLFEDKDNYSSILTYYKLITDHHIIIME